MLLMIEKTYRDGELGVDQRNGFIYINENSSDMQVKQWFDSIEEVLRQDQWNDSKIIDSIYYYYNLTKQQSMSG